MNKAKSSFNNIVEKGVLRGFEKSVRSSRGRKIWLANYKGPDYICLHADVSYFLCCTWKGDVCVKPSLIVFQRPAGRVFYFA